MTATHSPRAFTWQSEEYDEGQLPGALMQFRLVYQGRLPAESRNDTRATDKHRIPKTLHPQLRLLWEQHPAFAQFRVPAGQVGMLTKVADRWRRCGLRFMPIVGDWYGTVCGLDILFMRREPPGELIKHGGDLDNRIKTLLDALRMPEDCGGITPAEDGEDPFFCLVQDDALITGFTVTTDRLLRLPTGEEAANHVLLVINVSIRATRLIGFSPFPLA